MRQNRIVGILMVGAFILAALYGSAPLFLPPAQPASSPVDHFSAERAMQSVRTLSQTPRVVGTQGMDQAAAFTAQALQSCGLAPEIQSNPSSKGMLHNVVARIPGSQPGRALLIVSHLDSVSYGAGDNATGAAVLLECACALHSGKPLKNDIIFLFEDGEEAGYLGGYAFAATDESMRTVHRVIGLDTAAWGPVILLQTTPTNTDFIRAYASSVKYPTAFSFFADADWKISADTSELQPFYERGISGLELEDPTAFTGKHSPEDTVERIRPGSLQQMGDQVLALANILGNSDLTSPSESNQGYFTLWGISLVHYPTGWNLAMVILAFMGLVVLIGKGIRQKAFPWRAFFASLGILLAMLAVSVLVGVIGSKVFAYFFPNPNLKTGSYLLPASLPFFLVVTGLIGFGWLAAYAALRKHQGTEAMKLAGVSLWTLPSVLAAMLLPVGSGIFTLPLFAGVLCGFLPTKLTWAAIIPAIFATILFIPNFILAFLGTGLETLPLVAPMVGLLAVLWALPCWPHQI